MNNFVGRLEFGAFIQNMATPVTDNPLRHVCPS
jgi:hypothetical protein